MTKNHIKNDTKPERNVKDRDKTSLNVDSTRIERGGIEAAGLGIVISRNRLGGAGAVELRRGNRLDVFGDLGDQHRLPPRDWFDLDLADEAAAAQLTAALVAPNSVQPFRPFSISWEVMGPLDALERVVSYQLNVFNYGPIFKGYVPVNLTSDGPKAEWSGATSMWQSGGVELWAHFGSGIKKLELLEVTVDTSSCAEERRSLLFLRSLLETTVADQFLQHVMDEAGEDVTVTALAPAVATVSHDGFTFHLDIRLESSEGTITVQLGLQFMIVPNGYGNLHASFFPYGSRTVEIDSNLPWYDDFWHDITLGEHNFHTYRHRFMAGLLRLANEFASGIGRQVRGLPGEVEDELQEAQAPKAVATAIDIASDSFIVTLCQITSGLVSVGGNFPVDAIKLDP